MYCSHCGSSTADDLNYCKNCGFRTERASHEDPQRLKRLALVAGTAIGAVGLICFFTVLRELLRNSVAPGTMVLLLVAYLVTLSLMFIVLVRQAFKNSDDRRTNSTSRVPEQPAYFRAVNTAQLPDMPASVTEHTTRTLDEVPFRKS
jgi:hypothetical protein